MLTWDLQEQQLPTKAKSMTLAGLPIDLSQAHVTFPPGMEPGPAVDLVIEFDSESQRTWRIPVFQICGDEVRFPRKRGIRKSAAEILEALRAFPDVIEDAEGDAEDDDSGTPPPEGEDTNPTPGVELDERDDLEEQRGLQTEFPLHLATDLVELIAQKNQLIHKDEFPDWISHLQLCLTEAITPESRSRMQALGINFLGVLLDEPGFAPPEKIPDYESAMGKIIQDWFGTTATTGDANGN